MTAQDVAETVNEEYADQRTRPRERKALGIALVVAVLAVVLDQGSKALAVAQLTPGERVPLVGDLFGLSLVYNPGAAFSLGSGTTWIITLIGLFASVTVIVFAMRLRGARWGLALGLVLGGAVGNLIDRMLNQPAFGRGHVTDFLAYGDLFVGNVADIFVVIGVGLVCLNLLGSTPRAAADSERTEPAS